MEIILKKEDSYKPRVENAAEMKNSFFREVYQGALTHIADIADFQGITDDKKKLDSNSSELNNIIAFAGERGSGKTSAMVSLIKAIDNSDKEKDRKAELFKNSEGLNDAFDEKIKDKYQSLHFHSIDLIDPTLFSGKEQIIEVIVAKMFKNFKEKIDDKTEKKDNVADIKELLQAFQKVFSALRTLKTPSDKLYGNDIGFSESDLERLQQLAVGPELREKFQDLVLAYLSFYAKAKEPKAILLIPIDDVDLHMGRKQEIGVIDHLEDIRKYLCVKNVVVLLGVNLIQLQANLQQEYLELYKTLYKEQKDTRFKEPLEMAVHFLWKLIPSNRRLILPLVVSSLSAKVNFKIEQND